MREDATIPCRSCGDLWLAHQLDDNGECEYCIDERNERELSESEELTQAENSPCIPQP